MKFIILNSSADTFTYGTTVVNPSSQKEVAVNDWFSVVTDLAFIKDLRLNNIQLSDGVTTWNYPESQDFVDRTIALGLHTKDSNGSNLSRVKVTESGWNFQAFGFEVTTAKAGTVKAYDENMQELPYFTYKMYDAQGAITEVDAEAVKTVIDFEPPFDYELMSGHLMQIVQPTANIYLSVIGVPDVPSVAGGSKKFISGINLKYIPIGHPLSSDGRSPKRLTYSVYHTNKLRFIFNHGAGVQHDFMQILEFFKS